MIFKIEGAVAAIASAFLAAAAVDKTVANFSAIFGLLGTSKARFIAAFAVLLFVY